MNVLRVVECGGLTFRVEESPGTAWGFWDFWAGGQWETTTIGAMERLLRPDGLLLDIGAWVGPLTLWAAKKIGARVVAVEPDPEGFRQLSANVRASGVDALVTLLQVAIAPTDGSVVLHMTPDGGDAYSSMTPRALLSRNVIVKGRTLRSLINAFQPTLIKMDIEGGEAVILPVDGPYLRIHRLPLLLALHPEWYEAGAEPALMAELDHWHMEDLHNQMYLCTPKEVPE